MAAANARQRFEALLPGRRESLVTVNADRGDGTAAVTNAAGHEFVANTGGASVSDGAEVIIKDQQIIAKAPNLPTFSISV